MIPCAGRPCGSRLWAVVFFRESQFRMASEEEILKMNAWVAFKRYGTKQGDLMMDGGSMGIPVSLLPEALQKVAKSIPIAELSVIVYRSNSIPVKLC